MGNIQLIYDPKNESLWFGLPIGGETITDIFLLNIRSKAWSRIERDADVIASLNLVFFINYDNWVSAPYVTGSVTTVDTDATVEGTDVDWVTYGVEAGDYILFDKTSTGVYSDYRIVDSVTDLNTLETTVALDPFLQQLSLIRLLNLMGYMRISHLTLLMMLLRMRLRGLRMCILQMQGL